MKIVVAQSCCSVKHYFCRFEWHSQGESRIIKRCSSSRLWQRYRKGECRQGFFYGQGYNSTNSEKHTKVEWIQTRMRDDFTNVLLNTDTLLVQPVVQPEYELFFFFQPTIVISGCYGKESYSAILVVGQGLNCHLQFAVCRLIHSLILQIAPQQQQQQQQH